MQITKLSTKGQVVIPEKIREGFEEGTAFTIIKQGDLIIMKEVKNFTENEIKEIQELDKIWKEIDSGKCESYGVDEFFEKMKKW